MYVVTLEYLGNKFWLRSTVWTSEQDRASVLKTEDEAVALLAKAKPFMKAKVFKAAKVEKR